MTLHFIEREERLRTLRELQRRLRPGAPFAVAHLSVPRGSSERDRWLARYAAFVARLPLLSPEEDEQVLREAGFVGVSLFYVGFAFRGWVAYA